MQKELLKKKNLKVFLFSAATKLIVLFFLVSGIFVLNPTVSLAKASSLESFYTVKLISSKDYSNISGVGKNIHQLFVGNKSEIFQNIYTFQSTYTLTDLQAKLKGKLDYLEPLRKIQSADVYVNDPGFSNNSQNIDKEWGLIKAGFNQAWSKTTGSKNNIVAVIDTGIDATHEDLKSINYIPGFNFLTNQAILPGADSDDNGHGTLVAGVLGATTNNALGVAGTNWQISLMPIKALDASGKGDSVTVANAIVWATDHGAQFINLSLGGIGFGHDTTLSNAISYAFNKNVFIAAAAGNDAAATGGSLDQDPVFPICDDNNYNMVIGVAATDQNDIKPAFSNYGKNCIDVDAPGKRILSTISFDPLTKKSSPNSYAYGSGTSLSVPFVVGQAALIKALYPTATNIQIRDRIISTADPIDDLNLSQCAGVSCRGLLGAGRINVTKSLETAIAQNFGEGDLIKPQDLPGVIYEISGGQKRLVSPFVFNQRFSTAILKSALSSELAGFPEGPYVTPSDGTLVKFDSSPTVYIISNGQKLPIAYQVFMQKNLNFADVKSLSFSELNSWVTGTFLPPQEGTLLKTPKNKTVYWVVSQTLHPINYNFFIDRGLNIFPIMIVPDTDINAYSMGDAYIR